MKVATLITVPNKKAFNNCTLTLETVRVAFPTQEIIVYVNTSSVWCFNEIKQKAPKDVQVVLLHQEHHHAEWIEHVINNTKGELIIVDPDMMFHKEWTAKFEKVLAGAFVPLIWNEFAKCVSYRRIHTSFMCIRDCDELRSMIKAAYPQAFSDVSNAGKYSSVNPYMPDVKFVMGIPSFWDSCAVLFNMIGGDLFTEEHYECYDHINSSTFVDIMEQNMEAGKGFREYHDAVSADSSKLKGTWKLVLNYYQRMHDRAMEKMKGN